METIKTAVYSEFKKGYCIPLHYTHLNNDDFSRKMGLLKGLVLQYLSYYLNLISRYEESIVAPHIQKSFRFL